MRQGEAVHCGWSLDYLTTGELKMIQPDNLFYLER